MEMFVIVVMELDGTVRDTIGPFWDRSSALVFAERNVIKRNLRYAVRPLEERGVWLDGIIKREAKR